jgi:hypothetical protein
MAKAPPKREPDVYKAYSVSLGFITGTNPDDLRRGIAQMHPPFLPGHIVSIAVEGGRISWDEFRRHEEAEGDYDNVQEIQDDYAHYLSHPPGDLYGLWEALIAALGGGVDTTHSVEEFGTTMRFPTPRRVPSDLWPALAAAIAGTMKLSRNPGRSATAISIRIVYYPPRDSPTLVDAMQAGAAAALVAQEVSRMPVAYFVADGWDDESGSE